MLFLSSSLISALQCGFSSSRSLGVLFFQRDPLLTVQGLFKHFPQLWFKRNCSLWLLKSLLCCLLVSLGWQRWGRGQRAAGASLSMCWGDAHPAGLSLGWALALSLGTVGGSSGQTGAGKAGKGHCCWWLPAANPVPGPGVLSATARSENSSCWSSSPGTRNTSGVSSSSVLVWFLLSYQLPLPFFLLLPANSVNLFLSWGNLWKQQVPFAFNICWFLDGCGGRISVLQLGTSVFAQGTTGDAADGKEMKFAEAPGTGRIT